MFKIIFRGICNEWDDFPGQNGYLQIDVNGYTYGDYYPEELDGIMDQIDLSDWIERLVRVKEGLKKAEYVVLSDVDAYETWIEFKKKFTDVVVSIVTCEKWDGSMDIEYHLDNPKISDWGNQVITFDEFENEIDRAVEAYLAYLKSVNNDDELLKQVESRLIRECS